MAAGHEEGSPDDHRGGWRANRLLVAGEYFLLVYSFLLLLSLAAVIIFGLFPEQLPKGGQWVEYMFAVWFVGCCIFELAAIRMIRRVHPGSAFTAVYLRLMRLMVPFLGLGDYRKLCRQYASGRTEKPPERTPLWRRFPGLFDAWLALVPLAFAAFLWQAIEHGKWIGWGIYWSYEMGPRVNYVLTFVGMVLAVCGVLYTVVQAEWAESGWVRVVWIVAILALGPVAAPVYWFAVLRPENGRS